MPDDVPDDVINRGIFAELQSTAGSDFVVELIETFQQEAPSILAQLRNAAARGDTDGYRRAAHTLKANAQTFGAMRLGALARNLEHAPANSDPELNALALATLETEFAAVIAALTNLKG
jgi:histidine phosphotransfer protein HptB